MCSLQKCIRFYPGTLVSRSASEIFCLFSNSTSLSFSSCFFPHVFVKKNVFVCFDFVFRGGLQNLFVLMNGKTVDSLYLMGYFYITSIIFPIHLVYGRFACTTNSWCTHDLSMTYFYYAFKLYDGEHKRLAVNERVTKRTSEISLRYSCKSSCTVILRFLSEAQLQRTFSDLTRKF